jgi:lysophospholipase L1-like esterase
VTIRINVPGLYYAGAPLDAGSLREFDTATEAMFVATGKASPVNNGIMQIYAQPPLIGFAGDSITAAGTSSDATSAKNMVAGMQYWVPALTQQRVRSQQNLNFGIAGNTSSDLLARIGAVAGSVANIIVVLIGTNDINGIVNETTFSTYKNNMIAIWNSLLNSGKIVIAIPPLPRSLSTPAADANRNMLLRMSNWVKSQQWANIKNFYVIDVSADYGEASSVTWSPKSAAGVTYDGLHPAQLGGFLISRKIAAFLNTMYANAVSRAAFVADVYDAVYNPNGNLISGGAFTGTGGTGAGQQTSTWAGTIATNWSTWFNSPYSGGSALSGLTVTGSASTSADGVPQQVLTFSGSYTGDVGSYFGIRQSPTNYSSFKLGDIVEASIEIDWNSAGAIQPHSGVELRFISTIGGTTFICADGSSNNAACDWNYNYTATLRTPPMLITAQPTALQFTCYLVPSQGAAAFSGSASSLTYRAAALRKINV